MSRSKLINIIIVGFIENLLIKLQFADQFDIVVTLCILDKLIENIELFIEFLLDQPSGISVIDGD